ncbi:MAG TPA: hypothetical protein VFT47_19650 [Vicinamibacterales bacterium]|nr:hypothetical protein [Vicinamibacterales bacterium]
MAPSHRFVMAALSMALTWSSLPLAQSPTPMTDAHAHAILDRVHVSRKSSGAV